MQSQDDSASNSVDSTSSSLTVKVDKVETPKKPDKKDDVEDPKPRIVLTFRSEKSGAKSSNMKIVTPEEKQEEVSPRRSGRTRHSKVETFDDTELSKKDKSQSSQPVSESDETSDSSHAPKRSTPRRSKEFTDVLSTAIARKEKHNETAPTPTQRLSRRIKPTAKILANEELRIGLESQNNARLGIQPEKSEEGVCTRRSGQPKTAETVPDKKTARRKGQEDKEEVLEGAPQGDSAVMKLKHLCELGLKAIGKSTDEDSSEDNENSDAEEDEGEDEEIDDDTEIINKLLEADEEWEGESSDDDYLVSEDNSQSDRPRRSRRLCSGYGANDSDHSSPVPVEGKSKSRPRRSSRRTLARVSYEYTPDGEFDSESLDREFAPKRKKNRMFDQDEDKLEMEDDEIRDFVPKRKKTRAFDPDEDKLENAEDDTRDYPNKRKKTRSFKSDGTKAEMDEDNSNPAEAEEGAEAAGPSAAAAITGACLCEAPSNVYAEPSDLIEPVFCQAIEMVDGIRAGCSHPARCEADAAGGKALAPLLRAGPRAPYFLACALHTAQLEKHMCCPTCGLFCTQGIFYQCSVGHLFHAECGVLGGGEAVRPGCPHCGVATLRWAPANRDTHRVQLLMHCSNERVLLPAQRVQCTPAFLGFSTIDKSKVDAGPVIPEGVLPSVPIDLKKICEEADTADGEEEDGDPVERLYDAIVSGETVEQLIPKIVRGSRLNAALASRGGDACVHGAAARGRAGALLLLQYAGAALDAADALCRTPLMRATLGECTVSARGRRARCCCCSTRAPRSTPRTRCAARRSCAPRSVSVPSVRAGGGRAAAAACARAAGALLLLQYAGAALDAADALCRTPLMRATLGECTCARAAGALLLLQYAGAALDAADALCRTPLMRATLGECTCARAAGALLLLQYAGAALDAADALCRTPLMRATLGECTCARAAGALLLLQYAGAALDAADALCRTPLMRATLALLKQDETLERAEKKDDEDDIDIDGEDKPDKETETDGRESEGDKEADDSDKETEDSTMETEKSETEVVEAETEKDCDKPTEKDLMSVIRYLVDAGCDLNFSGPEGMTALHIAAQYGGVEVCTVLLDGGADVDARDHGGWTPLVWASENFKTDVVRLLLSRGADACAADGEGGAAAHWAALAGAAASLRALLAAAPHAASQADARADTPLWAAHWAALAGAAASLRALLAAAPHAASQADARADTPLWAAHWAALAGAAASLRALLAAAPHAASQADARADTPLWAAHWAALAGAAASLRALLAAAPHAASQADARADTPLWAAHWAALAGAAASLRALLAAAPHAASQADARADTPLWAAHWAALAGAAASLRALLAAAPHAASQADARADTPLWAAHWAALAGAAASLRALLAAAPHAASQADARADTPLHIAAREGHYSCVVLLLARDARTDMENLAGELPVEVCSGQCQAAISLNMQMKLAVKEKFARRRLLDVDISRGREPFPVECVNEVDDEPLPPFTYVSRHVMPENVNIDYTLQSLQGCSCSEGACAGGCCGCGALGVRRWYRAGRLPRDFPFHDPPMLFECNQTCACDLKRCTNHVVSGIESRGSLGVRVCVFRTTRRGWGLRAAERVPRGAAVALYCGELLPRAAADARENDHYMFALDVKPDLLDQCMEKTQLCVDAARLGSCARFVNHSCRPNLAPVRVFTATRDLRRPVVALFAVRDVPAGEELTFDYGDKFWAVKSKWMKCECEAPDCRYPTKSNKEEE
ncbi:uncharacterized protein [Epargyreus clarus]|uniref:uncharacterized protein n=1 Tax=Epargyreus clarus TaxID=520877 RepID=UPI003C2BA005